MRKLIIYIGVVLMLFVTYACSCKGEKYEEPKNEPQPLNISILLDLSDRITKKTDNVEQQEKDTSLVRHIVRKMVDKTVSSKFISKDKLQVLFYPNPELEGIAEISENLRCDMNCVTQKDRKLLKQKLKSQDSLFNTALDLIYTKTKEVEGAKPKSIAFPGSDIWGFFQNKVKDQCIKDGYRNILIIFTDGYIFHETNKKIKGGMSTYITSPLLKENANIRLLNPFLDNDKLEQLEVLMLEIDAFQNQEQLLKGKLEEWLKDMGVKNYKTLPTDLPANTKPSIDEFIFKNK